MSRKKSIHQLGRQAKLQKKKNGGFVPSSRERKTFLGNWGKKNGLGVHPRKKREGLIGGISFSLKEGSAFGDGQIALLEKNLQIGKRGGKSTTRSKGNKQQKRHKNRKKQRTLPSGRKEISGGNSVGSSFRKKKKSHTSVRTLAIG